MCKKSLTAVMITIAFCVFCVSSSSAAIVYGVGDVNNDATGGIYVIDTDASTSVLLFDPGLGFSWFGATDGDNPNSFFATPLGGSLYRIDVVAMTATPIGTWGGVEIKELAYNENTGILFATDYADLYTANTGDGTLTLLGSLNGPTAVWAMDYHPGIDQLVAVNQNDQTMYYVDQGNGNAIPIGPTGADRITDVWYDPATDGMFAITNSPNKLFSIDPFSGAATEIGDLTVSMLGLGRGTPPRVITVDLDIKPTSCPNPLNLKPFEDPPPNAKSKKGGLLPVAILGTDVLNVYDIDVSTILLAGVAPLKDSYEDVATPMSNGLECACTTEGPDGYTDLTLKFSKADIVAALGAVGPGDVVPLTITGQLLDGTPFEGVDCMWILGNVVISRSDTGGGRLGPAVPNPFNPTTRISYVLPTEEFVKLTVYDVTGKVVDELVSEFKPAGEHVVEWSGVNAASGVYFYRLQTGTINETRKMMLVK